jgi:hypothetical protein
MLPSAGTGSWRFYSKYAGTPPEHLLFALRQALDMIKAEGLDNVFRRHALLAAAVRRAVAVWARGKAFDLNIERPDERSPRCGMPPRCGELLSRSIAEFRGRLPPGFRFDRLEANNDTAHLISTLR